jgi:thiol-disulfide isomerase/thioredoxin
MTQKRISLPAAVFALVAAVLPAALPARAQDAIRGFQKTGEYLLMVNGKVDKGAEVYLNTSVPAYLVIPTALPSPVLLTPRAGTVETVNIMKIAKQQDGSADLLAGARLAPQGKFRLEGERVLFTSEGRPASLNPKPHLVGTKRAADLKAHSPEYVRTAQGYKPNAQAIAAIKKQAQPVRVRVFFGSWCPHCRQHLPFLLKVEDEIKGSKVQFEYFGLPQPPDAWQHPEVKRLNVRSVPMALVYVNGKETGRIQGDDWNAPEAALSRILGGARPAASGR